MQIKIQPEQADIAAGELLELSRMVRRCREETAEARGRLSQFSQMEECRAALRKQEEALELETAKLVNMASALREITAAYRTAETRNVNRVEEQPLSIREPGHVVLYGTGGIASRIEKILRR